MSEQVLVLELPWPPSTNHAWGLSGRGGRRVFSRDEVRGFRAAVLAAWANSGRIKFRRGGALRVTIRLTPPDRRRRDIDNVVKPTLDALVACGAIADDSDVCELVVIREGGHVGARVTVESLYPTGRET